MFNSPCNQPIVTLKPSSTTSQLDVGQKPDKRPPHSGSLSSLLSMQILSGSNSFLNKKTFPSFSPISRSPTPSQGRHSSTSTIKPIIIFDPWEENYKCTCCFFCQCCNIKIGCIAIGIIEALYCIIEAARLSADYHSLSKSSMSEMAIATSYLVPLIIAVGNAISVIFIFVAAAERSPKILIPHLAALAVRIIYSMLIVLLYSLSVFTRFDTIGLRSNAQVKSLAETLKNSFSLDGSMTEVAIRVYGIYSIATAVISLLVFSWFLVQFIKFYRYLGHCRQLSNQLNL